LSWQAGTLLTAASYNIHQCVGTDGRRDPERVATVIADIKADLIGLQEVDFNPRGEKKSHQLDFLAEATGMNAIAGRTIRRVDAEFGNALLTRWEIRRARFHDVSVPRRQPRGVIDADIIAHGRLVRVVVTHLGLAVNERRRQAEALLKILSEAEESYDLTVLLGDINEWRPRGFATYSLDATLGKMYSPRTFPSFFPVFSLDRIWVMPMGALQEIKIPNNGLARIASDHLPLVATVNMTPAPPAPVF
jgi:endonuclease/exonuclease/phosphatase family metal-dependent hydrolase